MHLLILIFAWITPALIAGALGWSGIWGSGSALVEYLIPVPVAGGVFHVPSFVIAAGVILASRNAEGALTRFLPVLAFGALVAALSLMLEFDRLNAWLFTDYNPAGSPFRLDGNPFFLFIATDAFWVGVYAILRGFSAPKPAWLALPLIPAAIIGLNVADYRTSGPVFEFGGQMYGESRGQEILMVYTSASFDEALFLNWAEEGAHLHPPWLNVNSEHVAVYFTNSMQAVKWGRFDQIDAESTVATLCLYEEDRSTVVHRGRYDCFADRSTVEQRLATLAEQNATGLGSDVDFWYARVLLCDGVETPESPATDIALTSVCQGMVRVYPRNIEQFTAKYGAESGQLSFVRATAAASGLE
jgi:hypothetical protein